MTTSILNRTIGRAILLLLIFFSANYSNAQLDSTRIAEIEDFAFHTPDSVSRNVQKLVKYLMKPAKSDEEKARIIYAWIASHIKYDATALNKGKTAEYAANSVLQKKKAVCLGMSMMYETMALEAGLEARTVIGFAKSDVAEAKKLRHPNHAWNVVWLNDEWQLVDVTWGQGYLKGSGKSKKAVKSYSNVWFNPDPRVVIYTHLPDNPRWSLIDNSFELATFKSMPVITPEFTEKGFTMDTIFAKTVQTPKHPLVQLFRTNKSWKIVQAPSDGELIKGQRYSITLQTNEYEKVVILSGKFFYTEMVENGQCTLDFVTAGKTQVIFYETKKSKKGEVGLMYNLGKKSAAKKS